MYMQSQRGGKLTSFLRNKVTLPVVELRTRAEMEKFLNNEGWKPNEVFLKSLSGRLRNIWGDYNKSWSRYDIEFQEMGGEINKLCLMGSAMPGLVPKVISIIKLDGNEVGYFMQYLPGPTLMETFISADKATYDHAVKSLVSSVVQLHSNGIGHGDLNYGNIICGSNKIHLIDPWEMPIGEDIRDDMKVLMRTYLNRDYIFRQYLRTNKKNLCVMAHGVSAVVPIRKHC
jgi:hypothetical protein